MKTRTDMSAKPYNKCIQCRHRKVCCYGLNTSSMSLPVWCEYMRDMKEVNGLTNAYIAEESMVSVKTIERIMSLNCDQDIMRETCRRIEHAILGASTQFLCLHDFEENVPDDAPKLKATLQMLEESKVREANLLTEIDRLHKELDYFRLENDRKARIIDKFLEK